MKKSKIAIVLCFMIVLCVAAIVGAMIGVSHLLVHFLHLEGVEPTITVPWEIAHMTNKKLQGFGAIGFGLAIGLPVLVFGLMTYAVLSPRRRELHGSAKLADKNELRRSSDLLVGDSPGDKHPSIIVGKLDDQFLLFRGQQFMYLAAPTRSGKGVGCVIPNLLHYRDSTVVLDIKGENFKMTAGFRASCGQEVHKLAPDSEDFVTSCWNPMDYVREDPLFRVSDIMSITTILYPPSDDVWSSTAEKLFKGIALFIMDTSKLHDSFNIATIKRLATTLECLKDEETFRAYCAQRADFEPLSEECKADLLSYAQTSDKVRNSIMISFDQPLGIFADPITAKATAKSTFDLRDVRKKRMSIYVVISPKNIGKFGKFLNLFFEQLLNLNMNELPEDNPSVLKYQCLILLDETAAPGRLAIIEKASAYMAGYNLRLLLIFQSKSQMQDDKLYGQTGAKTLLTNMALQICYAPKDDDDAEDYSRMIGEMTWKAKGTSRQLGLNQTGRSESISDQGRRVLMPQEVKAIGKDKQILTLENVRPALVSKIFWYEEPVFKLRANMPVPEIPCHLEPGNLIELAPVLPIVSFHGAVKAQELPPGSTFEVGFSPQRNALEVVMSVILAAERELLFASYSFTSKDIAFALVDAKQRGVDVRGVVDHEQNGAEQGGYNAVDYLVKQGIPISRCQNYSAMHHKFIVADGKHVQLGSFNYTSSANLRNAETAIAFRNAPALAEVYRTEWHRLATEPKASVETIMAVDRGLAALKEFGIY